MSNIYRQKCQGCTQKIYKINITIHVYIKPHTKKKYIYYIYKNHNNLNVPNRIIIKKKNIYDNHNNLNVQNNNNKK